MVLILLVVSVMLLFGFRGFLVANTASMEPTLRYNDLVIVRRANFDNLAVGDVVTFRSTVRLPNGSVERVYITHQIIKVVYQDGVRAFRTAGTNPEVVQGHDRELLTIDGIDGTNAYVGRVMFSSRILGNLIAYLTSPFGITMLILNAGAILLFVLILKLDETPSGNKMNKADIEPSRV